MYGLNIKSNLGKNTSALHSYFFVRKQKDKEEIRDVS